MAQERLEIIISAETDAAAKQITDFGKNLKGLESQANAASSGVTKFNKTVANANPTLVNFGRVLQDAPFGIIGIANNIDPLVSSFQSLKTQTGSASGAFKALGATLLGPAGIAVGISAATSALIAFGPQIGRAISGIDKFEQAQIDAAGKAGEAYLQAQTKFSNLVDVINSGTASAARQDKAFKEINNSLAEYGLQIDNVSALKVKDNQITRLFSLIKAEEAKQTLLAAKAAEEYGRSLIIAEKAKQGDVLGAFADLKLLDQAKIVGTAIAAQVRVFQGDLQGVFNVGRDVKNLFQSGVANAVNSAASAQKSYEDAANSSRKVVEGYIAEMRTLSGVKDVTTNSAKNLTTATKTQTKTLKEQVNVLNEIANAAPLVSDPIGSIAQLNKEITVLRKQQQSTFDPVVFANYQKEIDAIAAKIKTIQGGGALPPVEGDAGGTGLGFLNNAFAQTELIAKATAFQEVMGAIKKNADELVASGVDVVLSSVFNSLQNGDNIFEGLGQAVKGFVLQLIKAVAQALILNAILKAFNLGAPGAGSILSGLLGGRGGVGGNRAGGGMVLAGQAYTVGEFGAERFVPSTNGMIVPNDMANQGGTLSASVSGNSLLFVLNNARRGAGAFG